MFFSNLIPNSNYTNSPYFPQLSQAQVETFNSLQDKLSSGHILVSPRNTIMDTTPDWKLADIIFLECPYTVVSYKDFDKK